MTIQTNDPWKWAKAAGILTVGFGTASTSVRLMVYSGAIPPASIWNTSFSLDAYASQLLVGWTNFSLQRSVKLLSFATAPASVNATGTGTATWMVLCYGPTSFTTGTTTNFIIGETSLTNDNGLLQLSTLNIVAGQPVVPVNFNMTF